MPVDLKSGMPPADARAAAEKKRPKLPEKVGESPVRWPVSDQPGSLAELLSNSFAFVRFARVRYTGVQALISDGGRIS